MHKVLCLGEPVNLAAGFATVALMHDFQGVTRKATFQDSGPHVSRSHTEMGKRRFSCRSPRLYNDLPPRPVGTPRAAIPGPSQATSVRPALHTRLTDTHCQSFRVCTGLLVFSGGFGLPGYTSFISTYILLKV